jgi:hypothetical protein
MIFKIHSPANSYIHTTATRCGVAVSMALLCWPLSADALSLGRSRGAALLGRPLDVSILATLEAQEATPEARCFSPEVFYGDTQVVSQNVSVTPVRVSPTELSLRVRSATAIDEPFVTVYLRSACGSNVSRRYVLLSDSPSEPAPLALAPIVPLAVPAPSVQRLPSAEPAAGAIAERPVITKNGSDSAAKRVERLAQRQAAKTARAKAADTAADTSAAQDTVAATSALSPRAEAKKLAKVRSAMSPALGASNKASTGRLKLDVFDYSTGQVPGLRSSTELLSLPTTDIQVRAQAAALWRAINASPEDLLQDTERLKTIETDVRAMSELTKRQTKELGTLKGDLIQAQNDRYANPLVYALAALALAALAFAAWVWQRSRSLSLNAPWWGGAQNPKAAPSIDRRKSQPARFNSQANSATQDAEREQAFVAASQLVTPASAAMPLSGGVRNALANTPRSDSGFGLDGSGHSKSPNSDFAQLSAARKSTLGARYGNAAVRDFEPSEVGASRTVSTEELFDIQQQADFFMSLGQHTQAIDILQNHISDNIETSALAYLDLFNIYHKVGMHEEFAELRDEFNRVFNAQVPEYAQYGLSSRGLEDYLPAMQRIMALWPNVKVLEVIEESIFRKADLDHQPFDLLAYRELMLLYAIAKDVCEEQGIPSSVQVDFDMTQPPDISSMADDDAAVNASVAKRSRFSATAVQPLSAAVMPPWYISSALPNDSVDSADKHTGVDIDLDLFAAPSVTSSVAPKADNSIDFDAATDRGFRPSRPSKL